MTIIVKIKSEEPIYSPFSGRPADDGDGPNINDASLQWVYYGNAGAFGYVASRFRSEAKKAGIDDVEDVESPEMLARKIEIENSVVFEIDTGWNGVNSYCFALPKWRRRYSTIVN